MSALLTLQDVHAAYGLSRVLFGISLEVNEGETVEFDLLKGPKGFQAANVVRA